MDLRVSIRDRVEGPQTALDLLSLIFNNSVPDKTERALINAISTNDIPAVQEILKTGAAREVGNDKIPILSLAAFCGHVDMVKYLIGIGCEIRKIDKNLGGPLKCAVWSPFRDRSYELGGIPNYFISSFSTCQRCNSGEHRPDLVKILVEALSPEDSFGAIFLDSSRHGSVRSTPFQCACFYTCDEMIQYFLTFLSPGREIPIEKLDDPDTCDSSVFYHVITHTSNMIFVGYSPTEDAKRLRLNTLKTIIEKLPHSKELINREGKRGDHPLETYLWKMETVDPVQKGTNDMLVEIFNILGKNGAWMDIRDRGNGSSFLEMAIRGQNADMVEALLRLGCSMYADSSCWNSFPVDPSVLLEALQPRKGHRPSIQIIELLLAFGLDLSHEFHHFAEVNDPIIVEDAPGRPRRNLPQKDIPHDILHALQEVHTSGELISLKRCCRNAIRRQLKPNADEMIDQLSGIPPMVKRYLQIRNEPNVLGILE